MPSGAVVKAGSGIKAPTSGGTGTDLASALSGLLAGIKQEEERQEAARLEQAKLRIQQQLADASTTQATAALEGVDVERDRNRIREEVELPIQSREVDVMEDQARTIRDRLDWEVNNRIEDKLEEDVDDLAWANQARALLVQRYGYDPSIVGNMAPAELSKQLDRASRELEASTNSRGNEAISAAQLLTWSANERARTLEALGGELEAEQAKYDAWRGQTNVTSSPEAVALAAQLGHPEVVRDGQIIMDTITDVDLRDTLYRAEYIRKFPNEATRWNQLEQRYQQEQANYAEYGAQVDQILTGLLDNLGVDASGLVGAPGRQPGSTPQPGGTLGGVTPGVDYTPGTPWDTVAPVGQQRYINLIRQNLQTAAGRAYIDLKATAWSQDGMPIWKILTDLTGMDPMEFRNQVQAERQAAGLAQPQPVAPAPSRGDGPVAAVNNQEAARGNISKSIAEGASMPEIVTLVRDSIGNGMVSREEAMNTVEEALKENTNWRSTPIKDYVANFMRLLEQRVPRRLERVDYNSPRINEMLKGGR